MHEFGAGREIPISVAHAGVAEVGGKHRKFLFDVFAVTIPVKQRPYGEAMWVIPRSELPT